MSGVIGTLHFILSFVPQAFVMCQALCEVLGEYSFEEADRAASHRDFHHTNNMNGAHVAVQHNAFGSCLLSRNLHTNDRGEAWVGWRQISKQIR